MNDFILITIGMLAIVCGILCSIILVNEVRTLYWEIQDYRKELGNGKN